MKQVEEEIGRNRKEKRGKGRGEREGKEHGHAHEPNGVDAQYANF